MKKFFSLALLAMMMVTGKAFAQSSVLATLSHNGQISTFYGAGALESAHNAAKHGDVITLSSGSFAATKITKAVTIRGAGMEVDSVAKIYPTVIVGSFSINVADSLEQRLTVEGVFCDNVTVSDTLCNATFIKSRFYDFECLGGYYSTACVMKNVAFIHCKIANSFTNKNQSNTVSFVNSVVMNPHVGAYSTNNSFEFINCIVRWHILEADAYIYPYSQYAIYRNCILSTNVPADNNQYVLGHWNVRMDGDDLDVTNLIFSCLGIASSSMFEELDPLANSLYYTTTNITDVFKTWTGNYTDTANFELTDAAKAKYLGDDGKEVGIYGGNLPYTPHPTNPKITKFNVASKSTADGKLSVDIEVKAAE